MDNKHWKKIPSGIHMKVRKEEANKDIHLNKIIKTGFA
jgi:hypothetical protein